MTNWDILTKTAHDLINKDLFPLYSMSYLKDPAMLKAAYKEWNGAPCKSWRCPECSITINGPKSWIIQHVKTHHNKTDSKDNELKESKVNPYWYQNRIRI